ncbi:MAG: hypothetical protein KGH64_00565 [Candidatus Micrarchaeota archaeon]|nr:hypothetical protein [Candidatus Micrarchaeota archaeon]
MKLTITITAKIDGLSNEQVERDLNFVQEANKRSLMGWPITAYKDLNFGYKIEGESMNPTTKRTVSNSTFFALQHKAMEDYTQNWWLVHECFHTWREDGKVGRHPDSCLVWCRDEKFSHSMVSGPMFIVEAMNFEDLLNSHPRAKLRICERCFDYKFSKVWEHLLIAGMGVSYDNGVGDIVRLQKEAVVVPERHVSDPMKDIDLFDMKE